MAPLTGLVELYGPEISWAGRVACDEINERGGVLGRPLELVIVDDGSLPATAVPAAERLIERLDCVAIIGNLLSNSRIAVASHVAEPRRVPYLNFSFYEGSISGRYFFHFAALPNQQIDRMIPYMAGQFGPKMFFAGSNYEWPRGSIDAAKRALTACGGEILGEDYLPIGSTNFDRLLERVSTSGADVFVPYFAGADQVNLLNQFSARGLKKRMAVVMGHYDEAMVGKLSPEVREGLYSSNTYFMSLDNPENRAYLERLAALPGIAGIWPRGNGVLTNFGEGTYLCVKAFARAAERAGTVEAEAMVEALETVSVAGPQGSVQMDPATHHAHVNTYLARCNVDGSFTIIERFGCIPPLIPERYRPAPGTASDGWPMSATYTPSDARSDDSSPGSHPVIGLAEVDASGRIVHTNGTLTRLWRFEGETSPVGRQAASLWSVPEHFEQAVGIVKKGGEWAGTLSARLASGGVEPIEVSISPVSRRDPSRGYAISCINPYSAKGISALTASMQILTIADIAVLATNERGTVIQANNCASDLFGYSVQEIIGLSVHLLLPPRFRERHALYLRMFLESQDQEIRMSKRGEIAGYRKDGSEFPAEASITKFRRPEGWVLVVTLQDISERKKTESELLWRATHDSLTHLPNRALIRDRLSNALERSKRYSHGVALLFIDLDGFKFINDSYGHDMGDRLLQETAHRLVNLVRPGDTVARLGGDEFVVLCEHVDAPSSVWSLAERINNAFRRPVRVDEQQLFATASIGLAYGDGYTHSAEDMFRNADAAMYQTKEGGRDGWRVFNQGMHDGAKRRLVIATGLRTAVENKELQPYFQPIIDGRDGRICGAELLLRWFPPEGEVPPGVFIPIAEMTGSILPIGQWVFHHACLAQTTWHRTIGDAAPYVSVNISARQFSDKYLVQNFQAILKETAADANRILLEITETSLMADNDLDPQIFDRLADLGLRVAVDDFGTGYSSLSQLLHLPVNSLKIDRMFVDGLNKNKESRTIILAVLNMAHSLDLKVTAEGVESQEQVDILKSIGCDRFQGFHFGRPVPHRQFLSALAAGKDIARPAARSEQPTLCG